MQWPLNAHRPSTGGTLQAPDAGGQAAALGAVLQQQPNRFHRSMEDLIEQQVVSCEGGADLTEWHNEPEAQGWDTTSVVADTPHPQVCIPYALKQFCAGEWRNRWQLCLQVGPGSQNHVSEAMPMRQMDFWRDCCDKLLVIAVATGTPAVIVFVLVFAL